MNCPNPKGEGSNLAIILRVAMVKLFNTKVTISNSTKDKIMTMYCCFEEK